MEPAAAGAEAGAGAAAVPEAEAAAAPADPEIISASEKEAALRNLPRGHIPRTSQIDLEFIRARPGFYFIKRNDGRWISEELIYVPSQTTYPAAPLDIRDSIRAQARAMNFYNDRAVIGQLHDEIARYDADPASALRERISVIRLSSRAYRVENAEAAHLPPWVNFLYGRTASSIIQLVVKDEDRFYRMSWMERRQVLSSYTGSSRRNRRRYSRKSRRQSLRRRK